MADRTITASPVDDVEETNNANAERVLSYSPEPEEVEVPIVCIKIENSGFVRQLVLEQGEAKSVAWAVFQDKVREAFRFPLDATIVASYRDSDGDNIRIDSDVDLRYLLKLKTIPKLQISVEDAATPAPKQNSTSPSLPDYEDPTALAGRLATVAIEKDTNHLEFHPESTVVIDMVVDLVFSNPNAMQQAIGTLHELSVSTKIPLSEIFEAFNEKLKNHVPKETQFSANHVETCTGITDACRHLHYDLPPAYNDVEGDIAVVVEAETVEKKSTVVVLETEDDKDEFFDAPTTSTPPTASSSTFVPLTTAQLQQQYKTKKAAQKQGSINELLTSSFDTQKRRFTTKIQQQETPPNSEWATPIGGSPSRTDTSASAATSNTFAFSLRSALNKAAETHAQVHASILHQNPWLQNALSQAHALKDATCSTIDNTVPGAKEIKSEARDAFRFVTQATGAAFNRVLDPEEEVKVYRDKENQETVEKILKMDVVAGANRARVEELVDLYDGDVDRVVNELVNDRLK
ncbi:UNVERIFIED_CONTAM: hypothetical protein HDU68_005360 [Siphonaria sp. JEL0065]|nr:hypothetical protein HDU68_005360 [Siphonaria sp. JEL0065]